MSTNAPKHYEQIISQTEEVKQTLKHLQGGSMLAAAMFNLGLTYRDKISGFTGVATGFVQYISGCNQVLLQPKTGKDGVFVDSTWFDQQRIEQVPGKPVILDNSKTPGFDKPAMKR
jgi:hypothetical protein